MQIRDEVRAYFGAIDWQRSTDHVVAQRKFSMRIGGGVMVARPQSGSFEAACNWGGYERRACWLWGPFAIHVPLLGNEIAKGKYVISHAATGLLIRGTYIKSLAAAASVCAQIIGLADWDKIRRGKRIGRPRGMPPLAVRPRLQRRLKKALKAAA